MRRQKPTPDTRLDWRDPDMPVLRSYIMADGTKKEVVDPDYESRYSAHRLEFGTGPNWRDDPLYNAARRRR